MRSREYWPRRRRVLGCWRFRCISLNWKLVLIAKPQALLCQPVVPIHLQTCSSAVVHLEKFLERSCKSLLHKVHFVKVFTDKAIVSTALRQLAWLHFLEIIYVQAASSSAESG
jgi:hypothetical protein